MENKNLCRYDYVVMAVDALRSYMDTRATDVNTLQLIEAAHSAVLELKKIEKKTASQAMVKKSPKPVTAAIDDFLAKAKKLNPVVEQVGNFLEENKAVFGEIEKIAMAIDVVKETNNKLTRIKKAIDRRVGEASRKVA